MIDKNIIHSGDCLEIMPLLEDASIDLIISDLPYGTSCNKWDAVIPMDALWANYNRLRKPGGTVILFGQGMFSAIVMLSNPKHFSYSLIWEKTNPVGFLNAKRQPLRAHEDILIFAGSTYNPQKTTGHPRKVSSIHHKRATNKTTNYGEYGKTNYDSTERYPRSVFKCKRDTQKNPLHPTQKPVALIEMLIRTYSNEGDTVLDNCAGSGTTGVACIQSNRNFILIENDPKYVAISENRTAQY